MRYRWIPREENQVADTLADGTPGVLQTPLVYAEQSGGAAVAAALAEQIARLNQAGKMSFKDAMALRVGGMDQYSRWHLQELATAVGAAGVALIDAAFPGQAAEAIKARETALRWMVRGLVTHSWRSASAGESRDAGEPATGSSHVSALTEKLPSRGQEPAWWRRPVCRRLH